jgi:hypothetical protein
MDIIKEKRDDLKGEVIDVLHQTKIDFLRLRKIERNWVEWSECSEAQHETEVSEKESSIN